MTAIHPTRSSTSSPEPMAHPAGRPNIIFVLADDLGWADLSVYGQTGYRTPVLDQLAAEGVRFTQSYANSAVCSATRIALITGRYQYRLRAGLEEPMASSGKTHGLPPSHPTIASLLQDAGYETALIGKWHLGRPPLFGPRKSGYGHFFGNLGGALDYFTHKPAVGEHVATDLHENEHPVQRTGYYTQVLAEEACRYVETRSNKPFFLSLHFTAPHWPWLGPDDEVSGRALTDLFHYDGGNLAIYARMVQSLDTAVGQVLDTLERTGRKDNTIVVFTSDNGGERFSNTWPFIGQKTELLEGGLRVPTLLRWPQAVRPQVSEQVMASMDWLPTLLAACGVEPAPDYAPDGDNLLPVLQGRQRTYPRVLFWRFKAQSQRAVRDGDWKYLKINDNEFLFDLSVDQRERANLKLREPVIFDHLRAQWKSWNAGMLPITDEVMSYGGTPDVLADRYMPERAVRIRPADPQKPRH